MNPIEALMIAFLEDVSNPKTLCTYFLIGATVTLLLQGPIEKLGYPMEWSDRLLVMLGLALGTYDLRCISSASQVASAGCSQAHSLNLCFAGRHRGRGRGPSTPIWCAFEEIAVPNYLRWNIEKLSKVLIGIAPFIRTSNHDKGLSTWYSDVFVRVFHSCSGISGTSQKGRKFQITAKFVWTFHRNAPWW